jgi:eukaryotic-like serine/threonine-protein kinase
MRSVTGTGRVIAGRYRLLGPVGRGAMGIVWRGRDELLHRDVAVKQVQITALTLPAEAELAYQRTLREARTAARLSHPAVMTVFDVVEEDGSPWIIMELISGRSLEQVIAEDGPLRPGQAAELGIRLLGALTTAHAAGVLHRDVKPSNVLIGADGRAVLTDFGIATFAEDPGITQVGMVVGTPGFTAPERVQGAGATPASDLWSLGATLYAAVEGRGPFDRPGGSTAIIAGVAAEEAPRAPSAGPLAPVIDALLRRDPAARPDGAAAATLLAEAAEASGDPGYQALGGTGRHSRDRYGLADDDGASADEASGLGRPSQGRPSQGRPSQGRPSQGRLSQDTPSQDTPSHGKPSQGKLSQGKLSRASLGMAALSLGSLSRGGLGLGRGSGSGSGSGSQDVTSGPDAATDPGAGAGLAAAASDPAASFLDPPDFAGLRMPGPTDPPDFAELRMPGPVDPPGSAALRMPRPADTPDLAALRTPGPAVSQDEHRAGPLPGSTAAASTAAAGTELAGGSGSGGTGPGGSRPGGSGPADARPGRTRPGRTRPGRTRLGGARPVRTGPGRTGTSGSGSADGRPSDTRPAGTGPDGSGPTGPGLGRAAAAAGLPEFMDPPPGEASGRPAPPAPGRAASRAMWSRHWRIATAGGALAVIIVAAAVGFGVYERSLAVGTPADPGSEVSGPASGPSGHGGRHAAQPRPSSGLGSGGAPGTGQTSQGPGHGGKPRGSGSPDPTTSTTHKAGKTKGHGTSLGAPPAGYRWVTVSATTLDTTAGFAIAAPDAWTLETSGRVAYLLPATGPGRVAVNLRTFTYTAPLRQAHYQQKQAKNRDPGYRFGVVKLTEFKGAAAAVSRFSYLPLTRTKRTVVLSELVMLATSKGSQSYEITLSAPAPYAAVRKPVYEQMLTTFKPLT